jgi:hypothetical protein
MSFQLTSLRYSQGAPAKKQTYFIENSKKMKFQPKIGFEKPCFWSLNILILQFVKFFIMGFERTFFNKITKRSYSWIQEKISKK